MTPWRVRVGAVFLVGWVALATFAPVLPLRDPAAQPDGRVLRNLPPWTRAHAVRLADGSLRYADEIRRGPEHDLAIRRGDAWTTLPSGALAGEAPTRPLFVLGTDALGRDLLSRLVWGARVSLAVGLLAALVAVAIGGSVGLAAGLAGGAWDTVLMRLTDAALSVPRLFLLLLLAALFRPSVPVLIVVVGATTWMAAARLVRAETQTARGRDFVAAARSSGASPWAIATRHLLPHASAVLGVEACVRLGQAVLLEASLSFLGLGVPPPTASWGGLIADGRDRLLDAWWIATWPGLALAIVVIGANLVADGARERL